jgi:tetratricopeptide (TPR) repeat protein
MEKRFGLNPYNHIDDWSAYMLFFFQYIKENPELDKKLLNLLDQMAENKATISTTIHVLAAAAKETTFFSSFDHFPIRDKPEFPDYKSEQKSEIKKALKTMLSYLKIAHDKGITVRIGTDNREAGKSMISEFNLLSKAGFSTADILQIATWNGARAMNLEDIYGSVKVGYKADLVMFSKNPFNDYDNFNSKKTIIKGGKEYIPKPDVITQSLKSINEKGIDKTIEAIHNNLNAYEVYELIEIGYHLLHLGKVEEGKRILAFTSKKYSDLNIIYIENALAKIGSSLISQDLSDKSIEVFELVGNKFQYSFQAFNYLGQVYSLVGQNEDAMVAYKRAIILNQENEFGIEQLKKLEDK